jgi:pimeloyl-ACP methyl ester carboxylesterase
MKPVFRTYVDGPFGQVHVRVAQRPEGANAPPLCCLHQSPKSGLEFEVFMAEACRDRTVIAPDYPGYGLSDRPAEKPSIADYARTCWAVADALGAERIDLFGNHTGSKVAAEMAVQQPERVGGIVMVSAAILNDAERAMFSDYFTPVPLDEAGTRFSTMWERIGRHAGPGMTLDMRARSLLQNLMGGEEYEWGHEAAFAWHEPFIEALKSLPHRIIILNPADELSEATRRAAPLIRNGRIIECPQWGHGFLELQSGALAELLCSELDASRSTLYK